MRMGLVVSCGMILGWANYLGYVKGVYMWTSRMDTTRIALGEVGWQKKRMLCCTIHIMTNGIHATPCSYYCICVHSQVL
jgi:hypothetical protein